MANSFPSKEHRDDKGNYIGPRGEQYLKVFICHGCQSCWQISEDGESVIDTGPHFLSIELATKENSNG
jgi:lauroyl/myristoyl acyltransferase